MKKIAFGFTLAELLIVIAIIGILVAIIAGVNWKNQVNRGYDARRKEDLTRLRTALEEYYNDHDCYPPASVLAECGGTGLRPYLDAIPCDPVTRDTYKYVPAESGTCQGNRLCAELADTGDPQITAIGCNPVTGCGWGVGYNYCLASGVSVTAPGFDPLDTPLPTPTGKTPTHTPRPTRTPTPSNTPTPTLSPTPTQFQKPTYPSEPTSKPTSTPTPVPKPTSATLYACTPAGNCNIYSDPAGKCCPIWWTSSICNRLCGEYQYRCEDHAPPCGFGLPE